MSRREDCSRHGGGVTFRDAHHFKSGSRRIRLKWTYLSTQKGDAGDKVLTPRSALSPLHPGILC